MPSEIGSSVEQLKREFRELTLQQQEALQNAVYCGMTPEIAKQCEQRREKMAQIVERLAELCKPSL